VRQIDDAGNVSDIGTSSSWTIDTTAAPIEPPAVLTPRPGTKTVYLKTVDGKLTWAMKLGVLFSTGGDTRSVARLLTVQVAVDSLGRPVSAKPSDRLGEGWQRGGQVDRLGQVDAVDVALGG